MAWQLKPERYLTADELSTLRKTLRERAETDLALGRESGVRARAVLETAIGTGLRVGELAALRCENLQLSGKEPFLWVVGGKGRKKTRGGTGKDDRDIVFLPNHLVKILRQFLGWKRNVGESTEPSASLFVSKRGTRYGTRALQLMFKTAASRAGLLAKKPTLSIHSLRHTYGTRLYAATKDLRAVQKQLRHRSITTTTVYADVTPEDTIRGVNRMFDDAS